MLSTKDKIFQSALDLFASQGIQATSTAQISKKAGVASGTLFVHFKSKQELIDTIYISIKKNAFLLNSPGSTTKPWEQFQNPESCHRSLGYQANASRQNVQR